MEVFSLQIREDWVHLIEIDFHFSSKYRHACEGVVHLLYRLNVVEEKDGHES